jgi:hypothetical protein
MAACGSESGRSDKGAEGLRVGAEGVGPFDFSGEPPVAKALTRTPSASAPRLFYDGHCWWTTERSSPGLQTDARHHAPHTLGRGSRLARSQPHDGGDSHAQHDYGDADLCWAHDPIFLSHAQAGHRNRKRHHEVIAWVLMVSRPRLCLWSDIVKLTPIQTQSCDRSCPGSLIQINDTRGQSWARLEHSELSFGNYRIWGLPARRPSVLR